MTVAAMRTRLAIYQTILFLAGTGFAVTSHGQTADPAAFKTIPPERMQQVYDEVKTPFKYGVVIRGETNQLVDCPRFFSKKARGIWFISASPGGWAAKLFSPAAPTCCIGRSWE